VDGLVNQSNRPLGESSGTTPRRTVAQFTEPA
jgi:hypothetical protein